MVSEIKQVQAGSVTSPQGFFAGSVHAGLKTQGTDPLDLGVIFSDVSGNVAGTFTTNKVRSPSVILSEEHVRAGVAQAIFANSGCANCCVGKQGLLDAKEICQLISKKLSINLEDVLVCSTGMIGVELPMALLRKGIESISLDDNGGHEFAQAIMTTDISTKEFAVTFDIQGENITLGGCAKGAGMVHPNMATMLCFLTTDASVESSFLTSVLKRAVGDSFNLISVDNDTSTNDSVLLLANGAKGLPPIVEGTEEAEIFEKALLIVCKELAKMVARDAEGATKLIETTVDGAESLSDARLAARSVVSSILVKTAVFGNDPNWGRVMMALGKSGANIEESKVSLYINDVCIMESGLPIPFFKEAVTANMRKPEVKFQVQLNLGTESATAWGCDMSPEYVTFNSAYST